MARVTGLEPAASGVTGRRSNQLSYTRVLMAAKYDTALALSMAERKESVIQYLTGLFLKEKNRTIPTLWRQRYEEEVRQLTAPRLHGEIPVSRALIGREWI